MSHVRYWAMTLAVAAGGAFIAISQFAFVPSNAVWVAFGVAIGAGILSLTASGLALSRDTHRFSGLSALSALIAVFTIIGTRCFNPPTALWLAFAGGIALLLVSIRALVLHEATVERIMHELAVQGSGRPTAAVKRGGVEISGTMRSWIHWLAYASIALSGAFVVASSFIWPAATAQVSPRWLAFGVGAVALVIAFGALLDRLLEISSEGTAGAAQMTAFLVGALTVVACAALVVVMASIANPIDVRWWAFALGSAMVGTSLLGLTVHELPTERVRHALEGARAVPADGLAAAAAA
jgi:hypothetical protein